MTMCTTASRTITSTDSSAMPLEFGKLGSVITLVLRPYSSSSSCSNAELNSVPTSIANGAQKSTPTGCPRRRGVRLAYGKGDAAVPVLLLVRAAEPGDILPSRKVQFGHDEARQLGHEGLRAEDSSRPAESPS